MKLKVPFFINEKYDCGPVALKMVFSYFDENISLEEIKKVTRSTSTGASFAIGLAYATAKLGFGVDLFTISLDPNPDDYDSEFHKKHLDALEETKKKLEELRFGCEELGVSLNERHLALNELLDKINEDCVAIILLDWGVVTKSGKYIGHFLPIVGYDSEKIYVHHSGPKNAQERFAISREVFEEARKAKHTDEDILFIHRKR